ncbi:hypothetical protein CJ010_14210 [Azoarcus sp. DD4]|nr:hypothetical protein CJ010_14210 [Azoarcus sp. DD4]
MTTAGMPPRVLPQAASRDFRIDAAKAVGIVLVVLGHAKGCPPWLVMLLYSFHVPLFFWLAGAVVSDARLAETPAMTLRRLGRTLLLPYVFFFFAAYAYWLLTRGIGDKALRWGSQPWWEPLQGFVTGNGVLLYVDPALWFLPALFVTAFAYALLRQRFGGRTTALAAVVCGVAWAALFPALGLRLPFALDILPVALVFYALGAVLRGLPGVSVGGTRGVATLAVLAALWLGAAWFNGRVDLNHLRFGAALPLYLISALAGTAVCLILVARLPDSRVLRWLARNSLLIFASHMLSFSVMSGVATVAGLRPAEVGIGWALGSSALAILACVPLRWLMLTLAPWALGVARPAPALGTMERVA